jgi:hypothetical protein
MAASKAKRKAQSSAAAGASFGGWLMKYSEMAISMTSMWRARRKYSMKAGESQYHQYKASAGQPVMIQCQPDLDIVGVFPASMANQ